MTTSRRKSPATKAAPSPTVEGASPAPARIETYELARPDGSIVVVVRDLDTGNSTYTDK